MFIMHYDRVRNPGRRKSCGKLINIVGGVMRLIRGVRGRPSVRKPPRKTAQAHYFAVAAYVPGQARSAGYKQGAKGKGEGRRKDALNF